MSLALLQFPDLHLVYPICGMLQEVNFQTLRVVLLLKNSTCVPHFTIIHPHKYSAEHSPI